MWLCRVSVVEDIDHSCCVIKCLISVLLLYVADVWCTCLSLRTAAHAVSLACCCIFILSPSQIYGKAVLEAFTLPPGRRGAPTTLRCLLPSSSVSHLNSRVYQKMLNPAESRLFGLKLQSHRQVREMQVVLSSRTKCGMKWRGGQRTGIHVNKLQADCIAHCTSLLLKIKK